MADNYNDKRKAVKVKCKNCGFDFLKRDKAYRGTSRGNLRPSHVLTCSHKCSVGMTDKKRMINTRKRQGYGTQL